MKISPRPINGVTRSARRVSPSVAVASYAANDDCAAVSDVLPLAIQPARLRHDAGYVTQWLDQHLGSVGRDLPPLSGYNAYGSANQNTQPGPKIARITA